MTFLSKLFAFSAAVFALSAAACSSGEMEPCSATATYGDGCAPGLACVDSKCRARAGLHEACGAAGCADGLACGVDSVCALPGPSGAACRSDFQCGSGLTCNLAQHDASGANGTCRAPAALGAPCQWSATYPESHGGCASDLLCEPIEVDPLAPPSPLAGSPANPPDSFVGTCVANVSVGVGEPCNGAEMCAPGTKCSARPRPVSTTPHDGWSEVSAGRWEYAGVWPAVCRATP